MVGESPHEGSAGATSGPRLFVTLFGHLQMRVDGKPYVLTTRRKTLPLLAYLMLHRNENLARDYLAFLLSPDETEEDALTKLRSNLHELGKALPPPGAQPWLLTSTSNVRWNPATGLELDVDAFERAAADPERLDDALALYTNDLLEGLDDDWVVGERERLRIVLFSALERGIARATRSGDLSAAIAYGLRLLARDPFREDVLRRVMSLRDASGDRSGALAEFRKFEALVRRELGVDPMPETVALRDQIARNEAPFIAPADDAERPPTAERAALEHGAFVGREAEFERLAALWTRTRARRGGVVFVGGEAGIGKSRLIGRFASDVAATGGRVMAGGTSSPEAGPYQALVEALRSALPLVAALRQDPLWKQTLASLVPELSTSPVGGALPVLPANAQAERVHEATARALVALAAARPLVVVLEDLHWASAATLDALRALALRIALEPILIVVSYRDDELERSHALASALRDLARDGLAETVPLRALSVENVAEMARIAGVALERATAIHRATAGNAFFVSQVLACDADDGIVPERVSEAVAARIERLPEAARHVAEIAALAGINFSREIVGEVAGWNAAEVGDALDVLIARRLVRERTGRGPFNLGFAHELVRRAILGLAPGSADRHRRIARVIETCHPELASELALDLAAHYERAGAPLEAARRYALAARRALDLGAVADAETALALGFALDVDTRTRADLTLIAIEAGNRGDVETQQHRIGRLDALAAELDDDDLRESALEARARLHWFSGDLRPLAEVAALMRAHAQTRNRPRWLAYADLIEGSAMLEHSEAGGALSLLERALTAFEHVGDDAAATRCLSQLARHASRRGDAAQAQQLSRRMEATSARSGDYSVKILALIGSFNLLTDFGLGDDAIALTERWIALALGSGDRREESSARENHARSLLLAGRGGAALESIEAAVAISRAIGQDRIGSSLVNYAVVLNKLGAFSEAVDLLRAVHERRGVQNEHFRSINLHSTLALALAYAGDDAGARASGQTALSLCDTLDQPMSRAIVLENLAEIARIGHDDETAFAFASRALELRESLSALPGKSIALAALTAGRLGRLNDARALLDRTPSDERELLRGTYWRERTALHVSLAAQLCGDIARADRWLGIAEREIAVTQAELSEPRRAHYLAAPWTREAVAARAALAAIL